jgi:hypothetical protein
MIFRENFLKKISQNLTKRSEVSCERLNYGLIWRLLVIQSPKKKALGRQKEGRPKGKYP